MTDHLLLCLALKAVVASGGMHLPEDRLAMACEVAEEVLLESEQQALDPSILLGLIYTESRFNPDAVSYAGACGLTQVMHKFVEETCQDLKDPNTSVMAGARALRFWLDHANEDYARGLACYNAGYRCRAVSDARLYSDKVLEVSDRIQVEYNRALLGEGLEYF